MTAQSDRLLIAMAEQLKVPWLQIARLAELTQQNSTDPAELARLFDTIETTSQASLRLIDAYVLSAQLNFGQTALELEPVSISSALYDIAQKLQDFADAHACELSLEVQGKFGPVMADRRAFEAAILNLGYSFIEASRATQKHSAVSLVIRRNNRGIGAGVFSGIEGLSTDLMRRARRLYGRARQPLQAFTPNSGAGIFVADALIASMDSNLRVAHYGRQAGLSATFMPSKQLSLV